MPNSRLALHGLVPPEFTVCAPFCASNSRFMRLFQAALDTPLDSPFSATLSVHGLRAFERLKISSVIFSIFGPLGKTPLLETSKRRSPLRLLNALNSEDRGLKVRFSLATIAFDRESAQMSQILSSQGKNAPSNPYPHYLVRLATSRSEAKGRGSFLFGNKEGGVSSRGQAGWGALGLGGRRPQAGGWLNRYSEPKI